MENIPVNNPKTFQKTIAAAGTPEQLPEYVVDLGSTLVIKAKAANTGTIYVGFSSATADKDANDHIKLTAGQSVSIAVPNSKQVWIDASVNDEGVECLIA